MNITTKKMKQVLIIISFLSVVGCSKCQTGSIGSLVQGDTVIFSGKTIDFIGNSIVAGSGASDNAHRWTTLFAAAKGGTENNLGASGRVLQNATACGLPVFDKTIIPTYSASRSVLFISLGINDVGINTPSMTAAGFQLTLDSVVTYAITTKGWEAKRIILVTPYWITGYSYYNTFTGCSHTEANVIRHEQYVDAVTSVAVTRGCTMANIYAAEKNSASKGTFLNADGLHPNDTGHLFISDFMRTLIYYQL